MAFGRGECVCMPCVPPAERMFTSEGRLGLQAIKSAGCLTDDINVADAVYV